jgi:hypothetical protein
VLHRRGLCPAVWVRHIETSRAYHNESGLLGCFLRVEAERRHAKVRQLGTGVKPPVPDGEDELGVADGHGAGKMDSGSPRSECRRASCPAWAPLALSVRLAASPPRTAPKPVRPQPGCFRPGHGLDLTPPVPRRLRDRRDGWRGRHRNRPTWQRPGRFLVLRRPVSRRRWSRSRRAARLGKRASPEKPGLAATRPSPQASEGLGRGR